MIPKSGDSKEVRNNRQITCLTTMHKTLTGIIAKIMSTHLEEQSKKDITLEVKIGKDQLMISKVIYEDCRRRNKSLSIAWINYQKALDSVPRSWVGKSITLVGVNSKRLFLKTKQEVMQSQPIQIRRGIFQGDSLSPLLFALQSFH